MYHKRSRKHMISWLLAVMMVLQLCVPAYALVPGYYVFNFKAMGGTAKELKAVQNPNGNSLILSNTNSAVAAGSVVELTAIPDDVYHLVYWKVNGTKEESFGTRTLIRINSVSKNLNVEAVLEEGVLPEYDYTVKEDGVYITHYNRYDTNVVIPSQIDGKTVVAILEEAFCGNAVIQSVTIPATVTRIADKAFLDCVHLSEVTFEGTNITFGEQCFDGIVLGAKAYVPAGFDYTITTEGTLAYPFSVNPSWTGYLVLQPQPSLQVSLSPGSKSFTTRVTVDGISTDLMVAVGSNNDFQDVEVGKQVPEYLEVLPYTPGMEIEVAQENTTLCVLQVKDGIIVATGLKYIYEEDINNTVPFTGEGTEASPYQIETAEQLSMIGKFSRDYRDPNEDDIPNEGNYQKHFILMNDIDLATYSSEQGWEPTEFYGYLNGNGKTIKNLTINQPNENRVGLFKSLWPTATVKNLAIVDANITGYQNVGILAGAIYESHVEQVYVTGNVKGNMGVGGLTGSYQLAINTIVDCYARANVTASGMAGGLVGVMMGSTIEHSYAAGTVTIEDPIIIPGPIPGEEINYGSMKGGLLGMDSSMEGEEWSQNIFVANYYDADLSGLSDTNGATGKTTAEMKTQQTYLAGTETEAWDFDTVWGIDPSFNDGYPYLRQFRTIQEQVAPTGLTAIRPTTAANNDGKITGVNDAMEYKLDTASDYTAVIGAQITALVPATYKVRYKAKEGYNAGADATVVVGSYIVPTPTPTDPSDDDSSDSDDSSSGDSSSSGGSSGGSSTGGSTTPITPTKPSTPQTQTPTNGNDNPQQPTVPAKDTADGAASANFTDVTDHWAKAPIAFVTERGLFSGTGEGNFSPDQSMTRGMFVTVLGRLSKVAPESYKTTSFTDVNAGTYYLPYIEWASEQGIVSGTSEATFAPDQDITREQMAVLIVNYAKMIGFKLPQVVTENTFADNDQVAAYAKAAVAQLQQAGIFSGKDGNRFDPKATATRAEVSAVFQRFIELIEKK